MWGDIVKENDFLNIQKELFKHISDPYDIVFKNIKLKDTFKLDILRLSAIDGWLREINYLISETNFCLSYCEAYNSILKSNRIGVVEIQRNIYIKMVLNNLTSFMDKMAYLIYEIIGIDLKEDIYNKLDIYKLQDQLNKVNYDTIADKTVLSKKEFEIIKKCVRQLIEIKKSKNKNIFDFRNANNHRWNIGIDTFGSGVLKRISKEHTYKRNDTKESKNNHYTEEERKILEPFNIFLKHLKNGEKYKTTTISSANDNLPFQELVKEIKDIICNYNNIIEVLCNRI